MTEAPVSLIGREQKCLAAQDVLAEIDEDPRSVTTHARAAA